MRTDRAAMKTAANRHALRVLLGSLGGGLLIGALTWRVSIGAAWSRRIQPGWESALTCIGTLTHANAATGRFDQADAPALYQHVVRAVGPGELPGSFELEEQWLVWDVATGEKTVKAVYRALVDARSGVHADGPAQGQAFVFPRGVRPIDYTFRTGYLNGLTLAFQDRQRLEGLETYRFSYEGPAEYSEAYAGNGGSKAIRPSGSQQIKCRDDRFAMQVWVEPMTGEVVKLTEGCPSGDYLYETATDLPVQPLARWSGSSAEDEMIGRIAQLRRQRQRDHWMTRGVPLLLLAAGLVMLAAATTRGGWLVRLQPGGAS